MCRLLAVKSTSPFAPGAYLRDFARIAKNSKEYQGDGWGCAWLDDAGQWRFYWNIRPVWEDDTLPFDQTRLLLAHARGAFQNEGIVVDNNMPFHDERRVFIFNGELHGVRLRETGRIGAEKVFNFIKRFDQGDLRAAVEKGTAIIEKRCRHVRAMNIILADGETVCLSTLFNDDPAYYTMHRRDTDGGYIVCSDPLDDERGWRAIENRTTMLLPK
jgi:glutamine amidotransferase